MNLAEENEASGDDNCRIVHSERIKSESLPLLS